MSEIVRVLRSPARFTTIDNHAIRNPNLSRSAKGLLLELCSHSTDFNVTHEALLASATDGKHKLQESVNDLKEHGYLVIETVRESGRVESWRWHVTDNPSETPITTSRLSGSGENGVDTPQTALPLTPTKGSSRSRLSGCIRKTSIPMQFPEESSEVSSTVETSSSSSSNSIVEKLWEVWLDELGGRPPNPHLTVRRKKKLRAVYDECLLDENDALGTFRRMLVAVKRSNHHMSKRAYQMPESLFRNPERRETWYLAAKESEEETFPAYDGSAGRFFR